MGLFSGPSLRTTPDRDPDPDDVGELRTRYRAPAEPAWIGPSSEIIVTPSTAAQSVAIRSTADLIASLTSELPITVRSEGTGRSRTVPPPEALEDPGGDGLGREDWGYRLLWSWLLTGNAFGNLIDVDRRDGHLIAADLINPSDVSPSVVDGHAQWFISDSEVPAAQLRHWRVNPIAGRLMGLSPIEHHAVTVGVSLATTRFGREWFADGAHPSGMLTNTEVDLDETQARVAKRRFVNTRGSREPLVFGKGWKWDEVQISPEESQFLQTAGMSEAQCARIFGPGFAEILGYETGQKMTYSNIVDRRQDLLVLGMNRWFRRYERVLTLFTPPGQRVAIDRDALLEATTKMRFETHNLALTGRWRTVNEVREIEGLDPVEWGDQPNGAASAAGTGTEASDGNAAGS